jgi:hypothetical protein
MRAPGWRTFQSAKTIVWVAESCAERIALQRASAVSFGNYPTLETSIAA